MIDGAVEERWVVLGKVCGVHGVAGWIKVFSYTQPPSGILAYDPWYIDGPDGRLRRRVSLQDGRCQGKGILARVEGCGDRDRARALIGAEIAVPRDALPKIDDDDYYWSDLIGLRVNSVEGVVLGVVDHMLDTGANDVMVVRGERERLIPFLLDSVVRSVDITGCSVLVDWDADF